MTCAAVLFIHANAFSALLPFFLLSYLVGKPLCCDLYGDSEVFVPDGRIHTHTHPPVTRLSLEFALTLPTRCIHFHPAANTFADFCLAITSNPMLSILAARCAAVLTARKLPPLACFCSFVLLSNFSIGNFSIGNPSDHAWELSVLVAQCLFCRAVGMQKFSQGFWVYKMCAFQPCPP